MLFTETVLLMAALTTGASPFQATALDGRTAAGQLVELSGEKAVLKTDDGPVTFALDSLATLSRGEGTTPAARKPALWVELVDGSGIAAVEYTVAGETAKVVLGGGDSLEVPTRDVAWVRLRPPTESVKQLDQQWNGIVGTSADGDLLVVRKNDQLDYLAGVVGDVDPDVCNFQLDGDEIPVKRTKVEGFVYFHPAADDPNEPVGMIHTSDQSRLAVVDATLSEPETIRATLAGGTLVSVPLEQVTRIDFTMGKIAYLSDLDPEAAQYVPFFGQKPPLSLLGDYYGYRRDTGFESAPLRLDGRQYAKGLALQSRTTIVYRLPGKFRLFRAVVGIDESVRATGNAVLRLSADGKTLWEGAVRGTDPASELELELDGARRLEIVVDFGDDQDVGDRVNLCDARVTK